MSFKAQFKKAPRFQDIESLRKPGSRIVNINALMRIVHHPHVRYLCMESEACLPAPMARMTVAEPVTISPPAQTPFRLVFPVS